MRVVVQRVRSASVEVIEEGRSFVSGKIDQGLMVLLGISDEDTEKDVDYLCDKVTGLRIFEDEEGKMNCSLQDVGGSILLVSQFTLYGDCRKGMRPSFVKAARPEKAIPLYEEMIRRMREKGYIVETGVFGAEMMVDICNDGPVTLIIDSKQ